MATADYKPYAAGPSHAPASDRAHYHAVDFLRGVAAFAVLVWHYKHFYLEGVGATTLADPSTQPFYAVLWPFYQGGYLAVQFFWVVSGFVFSAVYFQEAAFSQRGFIVNRLARLYPLHFITLLAVAALQFISMTTVGQPQIYAYNDSYHLALNLAFASGWGLEKGFSFNAPIWSVSAEILVYAAFMFLVRSLRQSVTLSAALAVGLAMLSVQPLPAPLVWQCAAFFFTGVCVFHLLKHVQAGERRGAVRLIAAMAVMAVVHVLASRAGAVSSTIQLAVIFAGLTLLTAYVEQWGVVQRVFRRVRLFGDLTYSTYLWHVPLQILILICLDLFEAGRAVAGQPLFFVLYFLTLYAASAASFHRIEKPARAYVRRRLAGGSEPVLRGAQPST